MTIIKLHIFNYSPNTIFEGLKDKNKIWFYFIEIFFYKTCSILQRSIITTSKML